MKELVAEYLSSLKVKTGLSYEAIAKKSNSPESTVKNLCLRGRRRYARGGFRY